MSNQVYTVGYIGKKPFALREAIESRDAMLFDVRYSPYSRAPQWQRAALQKLLGDRYRHVRAFGNAAYKSGGMQIVDYAAGKHLVERETRPVVLMCACSDAHACHRTVIADMLRADGFAVEELDDGAPRLF